MEWSEVVVLQLQTSSLEALGDLATAFPTPPLGIMTENEIGHLASCLSVLCPYPCIPGPDPPVSVKGVAYPGLTFHASSTWLSGSGALKKN